MSRKLAAHDASGNITAFYDSVDSPAPQGVSVIGISDEQWRDLINAQSAGKRLVVDSAGKPGALDPPPPTRAEIASTKRAERDTALNATDWLVARHQDEKLLGNGTTLTADQFAMLLRYRQALREVSDVSGWPNMTLPPVPPFVIRDVALAQTE
ncbi:phage tail assembly chaperone [Burkholderia ubonensis]|uniref:phage tail assembly chaperone n=1 Tax=Burkholderia ubonensis TaxID=101571 RepID=UPI00075A6926|nr:phage tail assembly chaperone [Burkholderia ubonensis]KVD59461.1 phage tail protein [Burkholderia ubonensis]KVD71721.1 phage tail protein [Burkholderia ubonensis]KVP61202.1 phage tail protein [Burkholderia ubonensis]KVR38511.1 phage tail protein [Burkholderia ubonensis]KVU28175.1 phage tail protein [Burkholderia ubonensis]